ncbi:MAG: DUF559 domain-containing protein [Caulobacter sp.]|nr:DUF559 domain-containing protein [Caulobacter sp.]
MSTSRARELRANMTPMEVRPWKRPRTLRAEGLHFRRQTPFRGYYLDFVCFSRRLVVELDRGQHSDEPQEAHDTVRDAVLKREGFQVLRFWNSQVRENMDGVMYNIRLSLEAHAAVQRPASPPARRDAPGALPIKGREGEPS